MTSKELSNRQPHCLRIIGLTLLLYSLNIIRLSGKIFDAESMQN